MRKKMIDNLLEKPMKRRKFLKYGAVSTAGVLLSPLIKISPLGATGVVKIGFPSGLTGFAGPWLIHFKKVVDMIVEEYNAAGGIKSMGGAKIEIVWVDTQTNLSIHKSELEKLINVKKVKLLLTGPSALDMVGQPIAEKYGATMVSMATVDKLTEMGAKYYFRAAIKVSDNAKCATNFAWHLYHDKGKKFKNVAVITSDDEFGQNAGRIMEAEAKKHPEWNFIERVVYPAAKLVDASDYIAKLKAQGVEVLFQTSTPESGITIQQGVKTLDFNLQANIHAHGAPYLKGYADALKKDADYVYCATQFVADMITKYPKNVQDFSARFKKRYGEDLNDNSALGATMILIYINALERAGSDDPEKVREALLRTDLKLGDSQYLIAGPGVKFDEGGHNIRAETNMHQMRDQKLRCVWPETLKTTEPIWPVPKWKERA